MKDRNKWWTERKALKAEGKFGSSDISALLGLSTYKQPAELVTEAQGIYDERETELTKLGLLLEKPILEMYRDRTGEKPRRVNKIIVSKQYPWLFCSLDARVGKKPLEVKNVTFPHGNFGLEGSDDIPDQFIAQGQNSLAVLDEEYIEFPVLLFGRLRIYGVYRSQEIIDMIVERSKEFRERHILGNEPVPLDYDHPTTYGILKRHGLNGMPIYFEGEDAAHAELYGKIGSNIYELEKDQKAIKNFLLDRMGESSLAILPDGRKLTRQEITKKAEATPRAGYTYVKLSLEKEK